MRVADAITLSCSTVNTPISVDGDKSQYSTTSRLRPVAAPGGSRGGADGVVAAGLTPRPPASMTA
jgi:hypothetical protein